VNFFPDFASIIFLGILLGIIFGNGGRSKRQCSLVNLRMIARGDFMKYIYALLSIVMIGCTDKGIDPVNAQPDASVGRIAFSLSKTDLPQNIATLTFTLVKQSTGESILKIVTISPDTLMQVVFDQLSLGSWHVKAIAKDSVSGKQYSGESDVSVVQGQQTQLSLYLTSTTTGVGPRNMMANGNGTVPFKHSIVPGI
jgi:hypothetical protein